MGSLHRHTLQFALPMTHPFCQPLSLSLITAGPYIVTEAPAITSVLQIAGWGRRGSTKRPAPEELAPLQGLQQS